MNGLLWTFLIQSGAHFGALMLIRNQLTCLKKCQCWFISLIEHLDRILELESMEKDRNRIMFESENQVEAFPMVGQMGTGEGHCFIINIHSLPVAITFSFVYLCCLIPWQGLRTTWFPIWKIYFKQHHHMSS